MQKRMSLSTSKNKVLITLAELSVSGMAWHTGREVALKASMTEEYTLRHLRELWRAGRLERTFQRTTLSKFRSRRTLFYRILFKPSFINSPIPPADD